MGGGGCVYVRSTAPHLPTSCTSCGRDVRLHSIGTGVSTDLHSFVGHEGDTYPKGVDPAFVLGMLIRTSMWWLTQLVSECYVGFGSQVSIPDRMRNLTLALKAAPGLNPGRPMVGIYCPGTQYAMLGWPLGARTYLAPNWGNNNSLFLCFCIEAVQKVPPILCFHRTSQLGKRTSIAAPYCLVTDISFPLTL